MIALRAEGLCFSYPGRPLFDGLELDVAPGDYLAIVGPNGAGKSTLLCLLAGLLHPSGGRVLAGGRDVASMGRRAVARALAVVQQDSHFTFDHTVEDVVAMGRNPWLGSFAAPGPDDHQRVREALAAMDLAAFAGSGINELSGGERQRVVVARALAQGTPALLLDEAGSHLDLAHLGRLAALLDRLHSEGRTVVLVSHDLNFAVASCRRLLVLKEGRVVALGPPAEVLTAGLVRAVYGIEPVITRHPESGRPVVLLPGVRD